MLMARLVKCPHCKEEDNKDGMIKKGRRYWHEECLEEHLIEIEENKTEEDIIKERDKQERKELIDFILELFDIEKPTGLILKQIKNLHEEYGYRYKAIALTLDYFFNIQNHSTENARGIGIVPYVYDEASDFYKNLKRIEKQHKDIEETETKVVTIKKTKENKRRKHKTINMLEI